SFELPLTLGFRALDLPPQNRDPAVPSMPSLRSSHLCDLWTKPESFEDFGNPKPRRNAPFRTQPAPPDGTAEQILDCRFRILDCLRMVRTCLKTGEPKANANRAHPLH